MACLQENRIVQMLAGQLSSAQVASAESHLAGCLTCTARTQLVSSTTPTQPWGLLNGTARAADRSLPAGTRIGRYVLLDLVGRGGMGEVYSAYDPALDRRVALKLLHRDTQGNPRQAQRLLREAKAIARLPHANVVAVYDAGTTDDRVFVAMEFVDGQTVAEWMRAAPGRATWRQVLEVFQAAGHGLAAAHAGGIIHRDFKPQNLMIDKDGGVRVMDFGLARWSADDDRGESPAPGPAPAPAPGPALAVAPALAPGATDPTVEARLTRTGALMGTPAYMSPEQIACEQVDARSDQFSYCVSLYEALYGERPFAGDS